MSSELSEVQSAVLSEFHIVVNREDAAGNVTPTKWRLVLDYEALAIIEKATGRDLKEPKAWTEVKSSEYPVFVHAGLHRFHPDVKLEEVRAVLNPACQGGLSNALYELCFPGAMERIQKYLAEKATGATADPNALTETPSV